MKLLFRQRFFSWFDSYDIYDEDGNTVYVVKGQLSWGHCLKIFDASGQELGTVKEKIHDLAARSLNCMRAAATLDVSARSCPFSNPAMISTAVAGM